jgi:hypothetical protein
VATAVRGAPTVAAGANAAAEDAAKSAITDEISFIVNNTSTLDYSCFSQKDVPFLFNFLPATMVATESQRRTGKRHSGQYSAFSTSSQVHFT